MGFNRGNTTSYKYANVADGALWCGEEEWDSFTGLIRGIRVKENLYAGKTTHKLEILMMDSDTMDPANQVIISGTLYNENGSVTTWGRMLVSRLINPEHNLDPAEPIEIGVYAAGGERRATCAALRRAGDPTPLRGVDFQKDDQQRCHYLTEKAIEFLKNKYGGIGRSRDEHQADDEDDYEDILKPASAPMGTDSKISPSTNQKNGHQLASELYGEPKQRPQTTIGPDDDLPF